MRLVVIPPSARLAEHVDVFWFARGRPDYDCEKVLPNGVIELIFNLGAPHILLDPADLTRFAGFYDAWIAGLQEHFLLIQPFDTFDLVGIRFRPGGATPFLRFSPAELTNQVYETSALGPRLRNLVSNARARLLRASTPYERVAILEDALCATMDADWLPHAAVSHTLRELRRPAPGRIGALSQTAGLSHKHLIDRFREQVGTTPRLLLQIQRFQAALRQVSGRSHVHWTSVAHASGYFDQAHMIRAFHRFAGATPSEYLRKRDVDENHIIVER